MTVSRLIIKMTEFLNGNQKDICHFLKVWAYAKTIGDAEIADAETRFILEAAAVVHDIACPFLREKLGRADGKNQELYGDGIVRDFLKDTDLSPAQIDRIAFLVAHHHTVENVEGMDWRILLEADYLVNAGECGFDKAHIRRTLDAMFETQTGRQLLRSIYGV